MSEHDAPSVAQQTWDLVLGTGLAAVSVAVHLGGTEAVPANRDPSVLSVLLTLLAVGPLVVRRRCPVPALVLCMAGLLALVATRNTVGSSTLGIIIAFYTAVAVGTRRELRVAVPVMAVGVAAGLLMRPVDLSGEGALVHLVLFTGAGALGLGVRQRRERYEAEVVTARERAARSATEERLRITRELHDILGHAMSVMVVQAGVAERLLDADPARAREAVAEIGDTGRRSMSEMRQVLDALRADDVDEGPRPREPLPTLARLPELVTRVESSGLRVEVRDDRPRPLPQGLELTAYRVVQEALTNCLAHASATRASVEVHDDGAELLVTVDDDGRGVGGSGSRTGQGLAGMAERVALHGGRLRTGPASGGGYRVEARFPVP